MRHVILEGLVVITLLLLSRTADAIWNGAKDNKAEANLEQMTEWELVNEASAVCASSAISGDLARKHEEASEFAAEASARKSEAVAYLATIERVLRKRHNGDAPAWMSEMDTAVQTDDVQLCHEVWRQVLEHLSSHANSGEAEGEESVPGVPGPTDNSIKLLGHRHRR